MKFSMTLKNDANTQCKPARARHRHAATAAQNIIYKNSGYALL